MNTRTHARRNGAKFHSVGPNMTPLVDVVMVLLVFFMLAGRLATGEHFISAKVAVGATHPPMTTPPPHPVHHLDIYINTAARATFTARFPSGIVARGPAELTAGLERCHEACLSEGLPVEQVWVVLHAGPGADWGAMASAYEAARCGHFKSVGFAASR